MTTLVTTMERSLPRLTGGGYISPRAKDLVIQWCNEGSETVSESLGEEGCETMSNSGSFTLSSQIDQILEKTSRQKIFISQPQQIRSFLMRHAEVLEVLSVAAEQLSDEFPKDQMVLEINHDPENGKESLDLLVRQKAYEQDIMDRIDLIHESLRKIRPDWFRSFFVTTDYLII